MASLLPPFLRPHPLNIPHSRCKNAIYDRRPPLGPVHALWWPPLRQEQALDRIILFVPGNPGLIEFYIPFLDAIHQHQHGEQLGILALSYMGHTPGFPDAGVDCLNLPSQVQGFIDAHDNIRAAFGQNIPMTLIGHSVGAWVATQVLKQRTASNATAFLLFPTLSHIAKTPNGLRLAHFFSPGPRQFISTLCHLAWFLPFFLLSLLFRSWPKEQVVVLSKLIRSPSAALACLTMAHDEMRTILEPETSMLVAHQERLYFFYAQQDDWIGNGRQEILLEFRDDEGKRVVIGDGPIPHAFCISHWAPVALQCCLWLQLDTLSR
ncbi:hypothetical protein BDN72DRAFT_807915 [Pluteus cervinus]|uniref:Uncharacterized protein n=1 Tax=Pluteus cervinus TaxID=181527 RepID=A0ACD3BGV8_9AGAR|nr:hypothetical protein BDN72DRAFT_807915 [Pluteus cervinus]